MFPIYILDGKTALPEKGTYYIVARDGVYLAKDTGLIRAVVKVGGISFLKEMETKYELRLPQLPSLLIAETLLFFRRVYKKYQSEAIVLLYYSTQKNEYKIDAPVQKVTGTSVDYEPMSKFSDQGFQLVGTIHSHPGFAAFHSGTDVDDEKFFDGIHVTIGRVDTPYCTVSSTVAVNNNRFKTDPEKLIIGLTKVDYQPAGSYGYKRPLGVPREKSKFFDFGSQAYDWWNDFYYGSSLSNDQFYDLVLPDGLDYRNCAFPWKWLERVSKKSYVTTVIDSITNPLSSHKSEEVKADPLSLTEAVK